LPRGSQLSKLVAIMSMSLDGCVAVEGARPPGSTTTRYSMPGHWPPLIFIAACALPFSVAAQTASRDTSLLTRPTLVLQQIVEKLPRGQHQEIRVLTADFKPGGQTVFHTHPFPVTIYVLQGTFRLEMEGKAAMTVRAGEAMVMPPGVRMTGHNASGTEPLRLVIFSVSDPGTPFLDPIPSP
jgi:quercetin dioxygenase-like cupin family protein